jgi:rhizosphere induced protein
MSTYSLSVTNQSGGTQNIAVYQQYPDLVTGLPLVWFAKSVPDGNKTTFSWSIDWALNWGTTSQQLAPGVQWTSGGTLQNMDPTTTGGNNSMGITYSGSEFATSPSAFYDSSVPSGDMLVTTDTTFTVNQARLMSIAVYMNSLPAFAVQGEPNGKFLFQTHPTYWICTTSAQQSVAISEEFVSSPTEFVFNPGVTSLSYRLNDELQFVPS